MVLFRDHLSKFLFDRRRGYPFFSWGGGHKGEVCESASNPLRGYLPQHTRSPKPKNPATLLIVPRCVNSSNALSINCPAAPGDRKSTRLNSSHQIISYAVFCLKKK